jgi:hypothetical protein
MSLLDNEINYAKDIIKNRLNKLLSNDKVFSYVLLNHFFFEYSSNYNNIYDIDMQICDGSSDGGIDFVFYDEENYKVCVCQSKNTQSFDSKIAISEFTQMISTVKNFQKNQTGIYSSKLREVLQNALDQLPDEAEGNIEYYIFNSSYFDEIDMKERIKSKNSDISEEAINLFSLETIEKRIEDNITNIETVENDYVKIDKTNNILRYETDSLKGVMVNLNSSSLIKLFSKYESKGLFELNIRRFIKNKAVDEGINHTLNYDRKNFWFLNNGIIIACKDFDIDGDKINLSNFSIVNGGQTTTLIGKYKGKNDQAFFIPCKIVCQKENQKTFEFFNKIAEATNSQKPIFQRDIRSNSPEMKRLKTMLESNNVYIEIKRGDKKPNHKFEYNIRNDELGQLILSFVYQRPGTARSGKRTIFENSSIYNQIFRQNYDKDENKKYFLLDLIYLNKRFDNLQENTISKLDNDEQIIYKNGKQILFSIFGMLYCIKNNDVEVSTLLNDRDYIKGMEFIYGKFISNYKKDDLDDKINNLIIQIVQIISEKYRDCYENSECTSVSNFFKTDKNYYEKILDKFLKTYERSKNARKDIDECTDIFMRVQGQDISIG